MKALKFLKHMKQTDTPYNFRECELDEAIAELEALQSRSCEGCKYFNSSINRGLCFRLDIAVSKTFCCQGYEAKEH